MAIYPGYGITFPFVFAHFVRAAGAAFPVIGLVLLALRLWAGHSQRARYGLDDLCSVLAWLALTEMGACFVYDANHGAMGWWTPLPPPYLTDEEQLNYKIPETSTLDHLEYILELCMIVSYGFTKLSIIFFLRRIFVTHKRTAFDWLTRALAALVSAWAIAFVFMYMFDCKTHISAYWGTTLQNSKYCLALAGAGHRIEYAMAGSDIILDVLCLSLPLPVIWRLQLSLTQKLSVTGIFMISLMTVAASIARIIIYVQILKTSADPEEDINLTVTLSLWWSFLEAGLAYIASQLPALSQYLKKLSPQLLGSGVHKVRSWISLHSPIRSRRQGSSATVQQLTRQRTESAETMANGSGAGERVVVGKMGSGVPPLPGRDDRIGVTRDVLVEREAPV